MKDNFGFALMTAIIILVLFTTLGVVGVSLFSADTRIAMDTLSSTQSLFLAEAGMQYALELLSHDDDWSNNSDTATPINMSGGTFNIHYIPETKLRDSATIEFTGTKGDVSRKIRLDFSKSPLSGYPLIIKGEIHGEPELLPSQYLATTAMPAVDLAYYRDIADHKITGNYTFASSETPYYGLWYIDGSVDFEDNVTIYGSVIATGNVDIKSSKHVTIDAYPYPLRGARRKYVSGCWTQSGLGLVGSDDWPVAAVKVNDGVINVACFDTSSAGSGAYLKLDVGSCNERDFVKLETFFIDDTTDYSAWNIQYSDDDSAWTSVANLTGALAGGGGDRKYRYQWDYANRHRYWRLIKTTSGGGQYAEVQFVSSLDSRPLDALQVLEPESLGRTSSCYWSHSGLGSFLSAKVNDGNVTVACFNTDSSAEGSYLNLDLGADPFKHNKYTQAKITILGPAYATWDIQYYDDRYTSSWKSVYSGAGGHPAGGGTYTWNYNIEDWDATDRVGYYYRYWRLYKTDAVSSGASHSEIQFSAPLYPALVAYGNFLFQKAEDLTIIGLVYVGADFQGNLLLQNAENINFTGVVLVAGTAYVTIQYQSQAGVPEITPPLSGIPTYSNWMEWNQIN
jgi:hypothetical protein